ncbi:MAG TPA: substrate-binding domain-containing protein [Phycisphaerales bacterium]|nr:substrate-binding domain-containing protein [Phycisphaerales bacterium]
MITHAPLRAAACSILLALAGACALSACGDGADEPGATETPAPVQSAPKSDAPPAKPDKLLVGVVAKSDSNPVFQAARTGAEDAAAELSEEHGVEITLSWQTPDREDAQRQAQFIDQLVVDGADGITVSASDADVLRDAVNRAVDQGVEVVTFDSDVPGSKRFAYYGIDDMECGRVLMRELVKHMGEQGVVAVLAGNQNAPNLQKRVAGVREEAAKHPGITIKDVYYHGETAPEAAAKVQQVQSANPEITGWAMVGGWPLFTENALDGVYQSAKVVSVDHLPVELGYVRNGQVQALIGQDCYGWGYQTVTMLVEKILEGKAPAQEINTFELPIVTAENVDEYADVWKKWLRDE